MDTFTVKDIVQAIKTSLEFEYSSVQVTGEISNLSSSKTGHFYFTLSDQEASLSCALFRGDAMRNPLIKRLKDGDKVVISGPINVYLKKGTFQLICKTLTSAGKGDLKLEFERLKKKLKSEGLFELEVKKEIPRSPRRIAVLTASQGAAIQDFVNIIKRRSYWCDVLVIPCLVQGDRAPASLIAGLKKAQKIPDIDLVVLTRGGGSLEDLWAFNDEDFVRAVFNCSLPTLSAVGHQVDFTLCDFVADQRAETPSAAAQLISEYQSQIKIELSALLKNLGRQFWSFKSSVLEKIERINPAHLTYLLERKLNTQRAQLESINFQQYDRYIPFADKKMTLEDLILTLSQNIDKKLTEREASLIGLNRALLALSPLNVLDRGYTYIKAGERVVTNYQDFAKLKTDQELKITFKDGVGDAKKS